MIKKYQFVELPQKRNFAIDKSVKKEYNAIVRKQRAYRKTEKIKQAPFLALYIERVEQIEERSWDI